MRRAPNVGEMIYGCRHRTACGVVLALGEHVTADGMDHWKVTESWEMREVRVRREPNGDLYEVEIINA